MIGQPLRWIDAVFIFSAANGIFIAVAMILFKKGGKLARYLISALFTLHSIDMVYRFIYASKSHILFPHLAFLDVAIPFAYGPLEYLYVKIFTQQDKSFKPEYFLHFIPFIFYLGVNLDFYLLPMEYKLDSLLHPGSPVGPDIHLIAHHVKILHVALYQLLAIRLLNRYQRNIKTMYSSIEKINLQWMRRLLYTLLFIGILHYVLILVFSLFSTDFYSGALEIIHLLMAAVIFIFGYGALFQPEIFLECWKTAPRGKYRKSGLDSQMKQKYLDKLQAHMKIKQPFLDSELTLSKLAETLGIPANHLSQVINEKLHMNFYEFINRYRLEAAKKLMVHEKPRTILEIAFEVGFNSKSAFNSVFKKYLKKTPSGFRKTITR